MKITSLALVAISLFASSCAFAQDEEARAVPTIPSTPKTPKLGPTTVTVELLGGQKISGTIVELSDIPFRSSFGSMEISVGQLAGIKFASAEDSMTTIITKQGDSITGATDLKQLTVDTEWGQARINGGAISSVLFLPDLKWNASMTMNGKRWSLVDSKNAGSSGLGNTGVLPGAANSSSLQGLPSNPSSSGGSLPRPNVLPSNSRN